MRTRELSRNGWAVWGLALIAAWLFSQLTVDLLPWAHEYPRILGESLGVEVLHATELLAEMIAEGRIKLRGFPQPVTYHDPCDLGRTSGIYDEPRRIIEAIPGIQFNEMSENRDMALW